MSDLDLKDISYKLIRADEDLAKARIEYYPIEMAYTKRKYELILNSGMATGLLKEAEANNTLVLEDISEKYQEALLKVKLAHSRRETFMEISRNLRSLAFEQ